MSAAVKVCSGCKVSRPTDEFWKKRTAADGLQRYCRPCLREMQARSAVRGLRRWAYVAGEVATVALVFVALALAGFVFTPIPFDGPAPTAAYTGDV